MLLEERPSRDFSYGIIVIFLQKHILTLQHESFQGTGRFLLISVGTVQLISYRHMLRLSSMCSDVIIISAGLSCWLSSKVMALRQSPELRVILRAGCRQTGDIKESDESRRMNLGFCWIYSSGSAGADLPAQQHVQTGGAACVRVIQMGDDSSQFRIIFKRPG